MSKKDLMNLIWMLFPTKNQHFFDLATIACLEYHSEQDLSGVCHEKTKGIANKINFLSQKISHKMLDLLHVKNITEFSEFMTECQEMINSVEVEDFSKDLLYIDMEKAKVDSIYLLNKYMEVQFLSLLIEQICLIRDVQLEIAKVKVSVAFNQFKMIKKIKSWLKSSIKSDLYDMKAWNVISQYLKDENIKNTEKDLLEVIEKQFFNAQKREENLITLEAKNKLDDGFSIIKTKSLKNSLEKDLRVKNNFTKLVKI